MCCSAMCVYTLADRAAGRPRQIFWQFLPPQTKIKTFSFLSSRVNSFHTQSLSSWRRYPADPFSLYRARRKPGRTLIFCQKFSTARYTSTNDSHNTPQCVIWKIRCKQQVTYMIHRLCTYLIISYNIISYNTSTCNDLGRK